MKCVTLQDQVEDIRRNLRFIEQDISHLDARSVDEVRTEIQALASFTGSRRYDAVDLVDSSFTGVAADYGGEGGDFEWAIVSANG